jgi:hypothetical protein
MQRNGEIRRRTAKLLLTMILIGCVHAGILFVCTEENGWHTGHTTEVHIYGCCCHRAPRSICTIFRLEGQVLWRSLTVEGSWWPSPLPRLYFPCMWAFSAA